MDRILIPDAGSFRDRNNRVYDDGERIVRGISDDAKENWSKLSSTRLFNDLLNEMKVVQTKSISEQEIEFLDGEQNKWAGHLVHERIPFVSYPYEWSFSMLKDAAVLHLEIVERMLPEGWATKDASAYNIQWIGCSPVFIDVPSIEPYTVGSPWIGYRQFCMMFLYPLMLQAYKGVQFQTLLRGNLDGIDPEQANRLLGGWTRLRRGIFSHVYLHAKMQSRYSRADLDEARSLTEGSGKFVSKQRQMHHSPAMVIGMLQGLERLVRSLSVGETPTTWSNYQTDHSYSPASHEKKKAFVEKVVRARRRRLVWDLGCNTGTFSRICASHSQYVVAVDGDAKAIDRLYQDQRSLPEKNILPLVQNLANISPAQGWLGGERKAFDARGKPDLILCLALIHHIVISANIPLSEFIGWLRRFDSEIIIEFVDVEDDMAKLLLRNKTNQYGELTENSFEELIAPLFNIMESQPLKGSHRKLYHLVPRK